MIALSHRRRGRARGFTLIEVLVSLLIFSVGILGAIGLQARLQQSSLQNGDRARASQLANEMASLMWMKKTANPADSSLASDYAAWQTRVSTLTGTGALGLPGGSGTVSYNATTKIATITVAWTPTAAVSGATASQFVTTVMLP